MKRIAPPVLAVLPLLPLLLAPLVVLTGSPAYAAPQCQGQDPTVVGTPGSPLVGTDGDDVMVTEGATEVDALAGADLVCVTGVHAGEVRIETGDGNDTVDSSTTTVVAVVLLGRGVDSFTGGPGAERVSTGAGNDPGETVSTGAGADIVFTGRQKQPMGTTIELGEGRDALLLKGTPGTGSVDGGADEDRVQIWDNSRAAWTVDTRRGELGAGEATMPILGVEEFEMSALRWASLEFRGGPAAESLYLAKFTRAKPDGGVQVDMGNGDDLLSLGPLADGLFFGGGGVDDTLVVQGDPRGTTTGSVTVDLDDDELRINGGDLMKATSFAHVTLRGFDRSTVQGSAGRNDIDVRGCRATVRGGAGADTVVFSGRRETCAAPLRNRSLSAYGDAGADTLQGWSGDDFLIGGTGKDVVRGGPGRDVCSGETRTGC